MNPVDPVVVKARASTPVVVEARASAADSNVQAVYDRVQSPQPEPQSDQSYYNPPSPRHHRQRVYAHPPSADLPDDLYNRAFDRPGAAEAPIPNSSADLPYYVLKLLVPQIAHSQTTVNYKHLETQPKPTRLAHIPFVRSASTTPVTAFDVIEPLVPAAAQSAEAFRAQLQQLNFKDIQGLLAQNPSYSPYLFSLPVSGEPECIRQGTSCKVYSLKSGIRNQLPIVIKLITNPLQFSTTAIYDPDVGEHLAKELAGFSRYRVVLPEEIYYFRKLSGSSEVSFTKEPGPGCQLAFTQMPAFSGTTLADWIEAHKMSPDLNEMAILRNAYQIALALQFLNDNGLSHTDVHAKNVLVEHGVWFLCDFGLLQRMKPDGSLPYGFGNKLISPPERLKGSTCGLNIDAWSFGLLLYFALHRGDHLYSSPEEIQAAGAEFPISDTISLITQNLLRGALNPDPAHRHTIGDIVKELRKIPGVIPDADDDDNKV